MDYITTIYCVFSVKTALKSFDTKITVTYDDGLKEDCIYDVLLTYAQAYFIYVIESNLIVSNYSIRTDNLLLDKRILYNQPENFSRIVSDVLQYF